MINKIKKIRKEDAAFLFGFILIVIVVLATFLRPEMKKKEATTTEPENQIALPVISAKEAQLKIKNKENIKIIDIRDEINYKNEHIIDSISAPAENFGQFDIFTNNNGNIVYILSYSGNEKFNEQFAQKLRENNIGNFSFISGGLEEWKNGNGQTISYGNPNSFTDQAKVNFISPDDLKNITDNNYPGFILDIRSRELFSQGRIKNAVNLPLDEIEKRRQEIPLFKEIFLYGENETEEFYAGVRLFDLGFFAARILDGGLDSWRKKNFELVK